MKRLMLFSLAAITLLAGCSKNEGGGKNPQPVSVWDGTATPPEDLDATTKTATIKRASDLAWISEQSNANVQNTFEGWVFTLDVDIDLAGKEWTPIAQWSLDNEVFFKGSFDGAGHKIEGLSVQMKPGSTQNFGLFGLTQGSVIRDLHVSGTVQGSCQLGGIVANAQDKTLIEGCTFSGRIERMGDLWAVAGGISGRLKNSTIRLCHSSATLVYGGAGVENTGGITGEAGSTSSIRDCWFDGKFEKGIKDPGEESRFGGIVGYLHASEILGCKNSGDLSVVASTTILLGGIAGEMKGPEDQMAHIISCYNTGAITNSSTRGKTGGIVSYIVDYSALEFCYNTGTITPSDFETREGDFNHEINKWRSLRHYIRECFYEADRPIEEGCFRFSAENWPQPGEYTGWNIGNDPDQDKFWKTLGTPGTTDYPKLWWE